MKIEEEITMAYITGQSREQLSFGTLSDAVGEERLSLLVEKFRVVLENADLLYYTEFNRCLLSAGRTVVIIV